MKASENSVLNLSARRNQYSSFHSFATKYLDLKYSKKNPKTFTFKMHSAEELSILYYLNYKIRKEQHQSSILIYSWTLIISQNLVCGKSGVLLTPNFHRS